MLHHHYPAPTTDTIELRQVQEINQRLAATGHAAVTAGMIGASGTTARPSTAFPFGVFGPAEPVDRVHLPTATLRYLTAEGSPAFPYVMGHFVATWMGAHPDDSATLVIELHSEVLYRLSAGLGLRHSWGIDAVLPSGSIRVTPPELGVDAAARHAVVGRRPGRAGSL